MPPSRLIVLDVTTSTQDEARGLLAAGEAGPLWILARSQRAGRGRKGRRWISPPGNLHLSLLLTDAGPAHLRPQLSFVAALAAHKAISALALRAGRPQLQDLLRLKWPNDILLAERKLGGILLESEPLPPSAAPPREGPCATGSGGAAGESTAPAAVIIGWGVNLRHAPPDVALRWPAATLADAGLEVAPETLARELAGAFDRWLHRWRRSGLAPVAAAWSRRAWGLGREVAVRSGAVVHRGRLAGLAPDGALLLERGEAPPLALHAGEILHPATATPENDDT